MRGFGSVLRPRAPSDDTRGGFLASCDTVLPRAGRISGRNRLCLTGSYRCLTDVLRLSDPGRTTSCSRHAHVTQRSCGARHTSPHASRGSDGAIRSAQAKTWAVNRASQRARRVPAPAQSRQLSCPGRSCDGDRRQAPAATPPGHDGWRLRLKR